MAMYLIRGDKNAIRSAVYVLLLLSTVLLLSYIVYSVIDSNKLTNYKVQVNGSDTSIDDRLYTPTHFTKIEDDYFIVDCWHNRVLYSKDLNTPIKEWHRLDTDLAGPHSVAKYGKYITVEDTGRNKIHFYEKDALDKYKKSYTISDLGYRPHRLVVSEENKLYLLSSGSQDFYEINLDYNDKPRINFRQKLEFLENVYTRSFTFFGDHILFARSDGFVISAKWQKGMLVQEAKLRVPEDFTDLNDIFVFNERIVITAGKAIGVSEKLSDLPIIKNQISNLDIIGRPYYISEVEGSMYITEIADRSRIRSYALENGLLVGSKTIFDFIGASEASKQESTRLPK